MIGKVGFVGPGIMGMPMARNLMAAGYELVVYNRSPGKVEELAAEGAGPRKASGKWRIAATLSSPCCLVLKRCGRWWPVRMVF